ncbi:hypothetical protein ACFL7M_16425, partial [Thermodesulfobacteriota bacterium]
TADGLFTKPASVYLTNNIIEVSMNIAIDASALIAVIVGEHEHKRIDELTIVNELIVPGSIPLNQYPDSGNS